VNPVGVLEFAPWVTVLVPRSELRPNASPATIIDLPGFGSLK